MQKIGSFVLQQARFVYSRSYAYRIVGGACLYAATWEQRCNCILRNGCCDEEIYNFALLPLRFSACVYNAIFLDISVQSIFRRDARLVKIDAYSSVFFRHTLYKAYQFLHNSPIYLSSRTMVLAFCIKLIGSSRPGVSKIYHANITQTRYAVAREIPPPSTTAAPAPLLCAFRPFREFLARKCWRAYKTRCNSIKPPLPALTAGTGHGGLAPQRE